MDTTPATPDTAPASAAPAAGDPRDRQLLERLAVRGVGRLEGEQDLAAFLAAPGEALLFFPERVAQVPESWDVAVILPEVLKALPGLGARVLPPAAGKPLQARFGFRRWPAVVMLRDGQYVGAVEGMLDWAPFQQALADLRARPAGRAPIALQPASSPSSCH